MVFAERRLLKHRHISASHLYFLAVNEAPAFAAGSDILVMKTISILVLVSFYINHFYFI